MSFFQDNLKPFFKKRELSFIESYKESDGLYSFVFEKEKDLTWKAGQYGLFTITHKNIKNGTKPFSVASAPTESVIKITTRVGDNPSDYKKALLELKQGMKVGFRGPVGPFYLKDNRPSLLIAGGIGITPFRSILKQLEAEGKADENHIHLLYMDSNKSYLYKDELDALANHPSLSVSYLKSREDLQQEIDKFITSYKDNGHYFIAGPKSLADSISADLQKNNISKRNIHKDAFFGY